MKLFFIFCLILIETAVFAQNFELFRNLPHAGAVQNIRFSPDGKILGSGGHDNAVLLWEVATGELLHTLRGHAAGISEVTFSHDGKIIASASVDGTVKLWEAQTGKLLETYQTRPLALNSGQTFKSVVFVVFSPDDHFIYFSGDNAIIMKANITLPNQTAEPILFLGNQNQYISSVTGGAITKDGKYLVVTLANILAFINLQTEKIEKHVTYQYGELNDVVAGAEANQLTTWCYDGFVATWDCESGKMLKRLQVTDPYNYSCAAFSFDKKYLLTAASGNVAKLWDWETGKIIQILEGHTQIVRTSRYSPTEHTLATASYDGTVKIWKKQEKKEIVVEKEPEKPILEEKDLKIGNTIILKHIQFERSKSIFLSEAYPELERLFEVMTSHPNMKILLEGHTDNIGAEIPNRQLSGQRVQAVKTYLVSRGIAANRLETSAQGSKKPLVPNDTEENRKRNRRVEVKILEM